ELDPALRQCLGKTSNADRERYCAVVLLPLLRVHGFIKLLREADAKTWPHLAWMREGSEEDRRKLFRELRTDRWLDADEAVADLARVHLAAAHPNRSAWAIDPAEVFAGEWGVNPSLAVWKRLLDEKGPARGDDWKLSL